MKKEAKANLIVLAVTLLVLSTFIKTDNQEERLTFENRRILSNNNELVTDNNLKSNIITTVGESFMIRMYIYDFDNELSEGTGILLAGNEVLELKDIQIEKVEDVGRKINDYYQTYSVFIEAVPKKEGTYNFDNLNIEITGNKKTHKINLGDFNLKIYSKAQVGGDLDFKIDSTHMFLDDSDYQEFQDYYENIFTSEIQNNTSSDIIIKDIIANNDSIIELEKLDKSITLKPGEKVDIEVPFILDKQISNYQYNTEILYSIKGKDKKQMSGVNLISNYLDKNGVAKLIKEKNRN